MKRLTSSLRFGNNIVVVLLATAGLRLDRKQAFFAWILLLLAAGYGAHVFLQSLDSPLVVWAYFIFMFTLRYAFLFSSFVPGGIADRLKSGMGEERGYDLYEVLTGWMFFQRSLCFTLFLEVTGWSLLGSGLVGDSELARTILQVAGYGLLAIGTWVNIHSTLVVGVDTYYYRDLFLKRSLVGFQRKGPYAWFRNPMYGIGQANGYGAALVVGSLEGVLATLLNQLMMYVFQFVIEQPHVNRILRRGEMAHA